MARSLRIRTVGTATLFLFAWFLTSGVHALITGGYGNKPLPNHDWPEGSLAIANHTSRLSWWEGPPFGGGEFTFSFRGDAEAFNEALGLLAAINWPTVELHIHPGPHDDFWLVNRGPNEERKRDPRVDWSFTVWSPRSFNNLFNDPRRLFGSDHPNFREKLPPPRIDVYLGGGLIDWKDVKVPDKVRVVGNAEKALEGEAPRIRLTVYDMQTSKPVVGAKVTLVTSAKEGQKEVDQATTDGEGRAVFEQLAPGSYNLDVAAKGYATRSVGWREYAKGDDPAVATFLSQAAKITGHVLNTSDEPIGKAAVRPFVVLGSNGRGYPQPTHPATHTDAEGRFELELPTGYVQLSAQATGLYHTWTDVLPVGDRRPALEPAEPVVIRMAKTTSATVKLTDDDGKPIANQAVYLEPSGNPIGKWSGSATTDGQGRAVIENVPPGLYHITDRSNPPRKGPQIRIEEGKAVLTEVRWPDEP